jgi:hypothetical protein
MTIMKKLTESDKFNIILSKNRIARELKRLYRQTGERASGTVLFDLSEIERATGTMNQPDCGEILGSEMDI